MIKNKIATTQPAKNEVKPTRDLREEKLHTAQLSLKLVWHIVHLQVLVLLVVLLILLDVTTRHKRKRGFCSKE